MSEHPREDRIQDYVDDLLCREERAEVEQHLVSCAACQAEVASLRDLVTGLHAIDRDVRPDRDLLAGINTAIDEATEPAAHVPIRHRTIASMRVPLAAAAVALIAISAAVTSAVVHRQRNAVSHGAESAPYVRNATYDNTVDRRYRSATEELERTLAAQRSKLAPETVRLVEDNLRIIDQALAEARAAMRDDPNDATLRDLMRSAYEKKLDLLRNATQTRGSS
jgi:anti-sigma factor RsiW